MRWQSRHLVLLLALPFLVYFAFVTGQKALSTYHLYQETERLRQDIQQLEAKNKALEAQKGYLQSDTYVEQVAREELNLIKKGEMAIIVLSPPSPASPNPAQKPPEKDVRPNWQRWWDYLFGPRRE